jgi:hypothetical protein
VPGRHATGATACEAAAAPAGTGVQAACGRVAADELVPARQAVERVEHAQVAAAEGGFGHAERVLVFLLCVLQAIEGGIGLDHGFEPAHTVAQILNRSSRLCRLAQDG